MLLILHFIFSKNVKIGIKCSIAIPESPQTSKNSKVIRFWSFFIFYKFMDFIVYILFSENKNRFYIGFTSNLEERVIRHNQKSKGFTGNVNDWKVVYTENYETKEIAHKRELQIKSWKSRIKIQKLIQSKD